MKIRTVMKIGDSIAVTLPQNMGFKKGDIVAVSQKDEAILIQKVVLPPED